MTASPTSFFWYELMTDDLDAARAFYADVVGWRPEAFPAQPGMPPYTVMNVGDRGVAGLMTMPDSFREQGGRPGWMGYIHARDVDAATASLKKAGGAVHREPDDIPGVGRFSVVADPQGAVFMLLQPNGPDQPPVPMGTPGHIGWCELYADDWEKAFEFYSGQFGWTKDMAVDMGEMGTYQTFKSGDQQGGGMMNRTPNVPRPVWGFYFNVAAIDAALARVKAGGGQVLMEPVEVPGGAWAANLMDPQGAHFGLTAPRR